MENDMFRQTGPPLPADVEADIQNRFIELRREHLDDRETRFKRWIAVSTIIIVAGGMVGLNRLSDIKSKAKTHLDEMKTHLDAIEASRDKVKEIEKEILSTTSRTVADSPEKTRQASAELLGNPDASMVTRAIALAVSLQRQGKREKAIEKWRGVAHVADGSDNDLAARAWFSVGYLVWDQDPKAGLLAYDKAIRLKPDYAEAFTNRGAAKAALGQRSAAIADYDEAIRLNPDDAIAFYNRGNAKRALGRRAAAIADYDEAIRLNPENGDAFTNRGVAKAALGWRTAAMSDYDEAIRLNPENAEAFYNRGILKARMGSNDEALRDYQNAIELAQKANNASLAAKAAQKLRDLD